jgi:hypothetical protein
MKLRRTRIKKTAKANGKEIYTAEYKWGFWWKSFDDFNGSCWEIYYKWADSYLDKVGMFKHSEEEAKQLIDFYTNHINHKNACEMENKVVGETWENYP